MCDGIGGTKRGLVEQGKRRFWVGGGIGSGFLGCIGLSFCQIRQFFPLRDFHHTVR